MSLTVHEGKMAVLRRNHVDTDQIIPKQFLKRIERTGFGAFLFYDWRFLDDGTFNPDFELNRSENEGVTILLSGENFGCGSSREHAPWALKDYGFQVVIAPSFADIFFNNCFQNSMLPIILPEEQVEVLMSLAESGEQQLQVDLVNERLVHPSGFQVPFSVSSYWKELLVNGWDEIDLTLNLANKITEFEQSRR